MIRPRCLALVLISALLGGCGLTLRLRAHSVRTLRAEPYRRDTEPVIRASADEITRRLDDYAERKRVRSSPPPDWVSKHDPQRFKRVIHAVDWALERGRVSLAESLVARHQKALGEGASIFFCDDPALVRVATVSAQYRRRGKGGSLYLRVTRSDGWSGPVAIIFPPGSFGRPYLSASDEERYGDWPVPSSGNQAGVPSEQDLVLLESRTLWLEPGVDDATIRSSVACGRFSKGEPRHGQSFVLERFTKSEAMFQLSVEICLASRRFIDHGAAQLAVWIVREGLEWRNYEDHRRRFGPSMTFETGEVIDDDDLLQAASLLIDSGFDPRASKFFRSSSGAPRRRPW